MKKIGTITFHWVDNYGAVLQSYALQQYLSENGYETEIINYLPWKVRLIKRVESLKKGNFALTKKEKEIDKFRKNELKVSSKKYYTNKSLFKCADDYNAVICGSDQVWNQSFLQHSEFKTNYSYYLDFVGDKTKKIAYAVSFGKEDFSQEIKDLIAPFVKRLNCISVREQSGKKLLESMGINSTLVVDPTLLITAEKYEKLIENIAPQNNINMFSYILHNNQTVAENTCEYISKKYGDSYNKNEILNCGIYEWLAKIKDSKIVVTNSFHGIIFSLIFEKPFVAIRVQNSGMNGRIDTLLSYTGLEDRAIEQFDAKKIDEIINRNIDWEYVRIRFDMLRKNSCLFLMEALKDEN